MEMKRIKVMASRLMAVTILGKIAVAAVVWAMCLNAAWAEVWATDHTCFVSVEWDPVPGASYYQIGLVDGLNLRWLENEQGKYSSGTHLTRTFYNYKWVGSVMDPGYVLGGVEFEVYAYFSGGASIFLGRAAGRAFNDKQEEGFTTKIYAPTEFITAPRELYATESGECSFWWRYGNDPNGAMNFNNRVMLQPMGLRTWWIAGVASNYVSITRNPNTWAAILTVSPNLPCEMETSINLQEYSLPITLKPLRGPFKETIDGVEWTYRLGTQVYLGDGSGSSVIPRQTAGEIKIPETLGGYPVKSIPDKAFCLCSGLTSVIIPSGVTSIGSSAFAYCRGLTSVIIPSGVTSIGSSAFAYCSGLTSVTIPESVISIGNSAFSYCHGMTSVMISPGVTSIGDSAFENCTSLTSVTIPFGVTGVGERLFSGCADLVSVAIPSSVKRIGCDAFGGCLKLSELHIDSIESWCNISFAGSVFVPNYGPFFSSEAEEHTLWVNGEKMTCLEIPAGVTAIPDFAFCGWKKLAKVTIPSSVKSIGISAFRDCSGLTSVTIPSGVTSIGVGAFSCCSGLTSVTIPSSVTSIRQFTFYHCYRLTSVTIPEGVRSIVSEAFEGCSGLTSVTIPSSVTSIGEDAFFGCIALSELYVEDGNKSYVVEDEVLYDKAKTRLIKCSVEKQGIISIPSSVTSIDSGAFSNCGGLTSVTISSGMTSIGEDAFRDCSGLTSVTIPSSVTSIGYNAFRGCSGLTSVTIPSSVTSIWAAAFYGCSGLTSVTIPSGVTRIGGAAFYGCSGLTSVTIPSGVTSIESNAFYGCSGLTSVTIPSGVTSIEMSAFYGCSGLTSVTIPSSVTSIGYNAFRGCSGLTSVTIPSSVTSIEMSAFDRCSGLTSVTIPSSVKSIGNYAFRGCSGLTSVTIPSSVKSIGNYAFEGCSGLTSVTIPSGVTSIGSSAFSECSGLTSVTIPSSVTSIGEDAFFGCIALSELYVEDGNKSYVVEDEVLYDKAKTRLIKCSVEKQGTISIPSSVTNIDSGAFSHCSGLTSILVDADNSAYCSENGILYNKTKTVLIICPDGVCGTLTIPSSVISIGRYAFENCSGLTSVTIPLSVTSIDSSAFLYCKMKFIGVSIGDEKRIRDLLSSSGFDVSNLIFYEVGSSHVVLFDLGEHGTRAGGGDLMQIAGNSCAAIAPIVQAQTGWRFDGWDADFSCVTSNMTISARYSQIVHAVSFVVGEHGTRVGGGELNQAVVHGNAAVAPIITPETGYTFSGWDRVFTNVTCDLTVKAKYSAVSYRIDYFNTRGSANANPNTYTVEDEVTFAALADLPAWRFAGWEPARIVRGTTGDFVVTAKWERVEAAVDDGTGKRWYVGDTYERTIESPVVSGGTQLVLSAWSVWNVTNFNVIASGTNATIRFEIRNAGPYGVETEWMTNYWLEVVAPTNGTILGAESGWEPIDESLALLATPFEGRSLDGWFGDTEGCTVTNGGTVLIVPMNRARRIGANFARNAYTVTFDLGEHGTRVGGGELEQTVAHGAAAVAPEVAGLDGLTFLRWNGELDHILGETVFRALYSSGVRHTVRFDVGEGAAHWLGGGALVQEVYDHQPAELPSLQLRDGFALVRWNGDPTTITEPVTLTAIYERVNNGSFVSEMIDGREWCGTVQNGCVVLTGVSPSAGCVVVPEQICSLPVTVIGEGAFTGLRDMEELVLASTVTSIQSQLPLVKNCQSLRRLDFGESVFKPGIRVDQLIVNCPVLEEVVFGSDYNSYTPITYYSWLDRLRELFSSSRSQVLTRMYFRGNAPSGYLSNCPTNLSWFVTRGTTGWGEDENGVLPSKWPKDVPSDPSAVQVNLRYWEDAYPVRFDLGGCGQRVGGGALEQAVVRSSAAELPEVEGTFGWKFLRWDADVSNVTGPMTVHAVYTDECEHEVVFDAGDHGQLEVAGKVTADWRVSVTDRGAVVPPLVVAESGWQFIGWDRDINDITSDCKVQAVYAPLAAGETIRESVEGYEWVATVDGEYATIVSVWPKEGDVVMPETLGGKRVMTFLQNVFAQTGFTSVTIANSVTGMPRGAFNNMQKLESLVIGDGVEIVYQLTSSVSLSNLVVGSHVRYIDVSSPFDVWANGCLKKVVFRGAEPRFFPYYSSSKPSSFVTLTESKLSPDLRFYATYGTAGWIDPATGELPLLWNSRPIEWLDESYPVRFDLGEGGVRVGGGELEQMVVRGHAAIAPEVAGLDGLAFLRWDGDIEHILGETVFRAVYSSGEAHTVTFDLGEYGRWVGGGALEQKVLDAEAPILPEVEAETGWRFVGWEGANPESVVADCRFVASYAVIDGPLTVRERIGGVELVVGITSNAATIIDVALLNSTDVEIPSHIMGKPVTSIGNAFVGSWATSIVIPDTVVGQLNNFTDGYNLTNLVIGSGVTSVGFTVPYTSSCLWPKLSRLVIGAGVKNISCSSSSIFPNLVELYFAGDCPNGFSAGGSAARYLVTQGNSNLVVYVTRNTTGWTDAVNELPAQFSGRELRWWDDSVTVMFDLGENGTRVGGGETIQQIVRGCAAAMPDVRGVDGWVFRRWDCAFDRVLSNTTVRAVYSNGRCHLVTFDLGEHGSRVGGGLTEQLVYEGDSVTAPVVEAQPGWLFDGWSETFGVIDCDCTVIARYSPLADTVEVRETIDGWTWTGVLSNDCVTVTNCTGMGGSSVRVPSYLFGKRVIAMGPRTFANISSYLYSSSLEIPDTFEGGMSCNWQLQTLILGDGITQFSLGYPLPRNEVTLGKNVRSILSSYGNSSSPIKFYFNGDAVPAMSFVGYSAPYPLVGLTVNSNQVIFVTHGTEGWTDDNGVLPDRWPDENGARIRWWEAYHHVTFDIGAWGERVGGGLLEQRVMHGYAAELPEIEWREGRVFGGWEGETDSILKDVVLRPRFLNGQKFTVTFDLGEHGTRVGGGELTQTIVYGEAAVAPEVEAAKGWEFVGWDCEFTNVTCDLVVTAKWKEVELIPPLPPEPTTDDVRQALEVVADPKLQECITEPDEYDEFREWAGKVKDEGGREPAGVQAVCDSPNAWLSYALDSDRLVAAAPEDGAVKVDEFKPSATDDAKLGSFDLTVSVENLPVGENAKPENLAKVFGIDGGPSLTDLSADKVVIDIGTPEQGKVKLTARPKGDAPTTFFMRVKMRP